MMYNIQNKLMVVLILLLTFSFANYKAQEIKNSKLSFNLKTEFNSLSKKVVTNDNKKIYTSEILQVPLNNIEPFLAVGFKAKFNNDSPLINMLVRASSDGNEWTEWYHSEEDDLGVMGTKYYSGELVYFNPDVKYFQYKIILTKKANSTFSEIENLEFTFISPGATPVDVIEENIARSKSLKKSSNTVPRPVYVDRKGWGCPQSEHVSSRSLTDVTHLIVHHSAGNTTSSDFAAIVRAYWELHVNTNGWADIGYNWLVDPNGVLYKGRAWKSAGQENVQGAHNSGKNGGSTGICFIGNYETAQPKEEGLNKLYKILAFLSDKYNIDPVGTSYHNAIAKVNDNIDGHGQSGGGTACPGKNIINKLADIRANTQAQMIDITAVPLVQTVFPSAGVDSINSTMGIKFSFSHSMASQTVESALLIEPEIEGSFEWSSDYTQFTFLPETSFVPQTEYNVTIGGSAMSKWIVPLTTDHTTSFVIKKKDRLSLIAAYPANGETNVSKDIKVDLKFDASLKSNSLGGNVYFLNENGESVSLNIDFNAYSDGRISFTPSNSLDEGKTYSIILKDGITDTYGNSFGDSVKIVFTTESITGTEEDNSLINKFYLEQNYPNPFNPTTVISYQLPSNSFVSLAVFDILGNKIATLVNGNKASGKHKVSWDASGLSSGIYIYQLSSGAFLETKKMILQK
ncbi:MAG: Ig-like domain-containing protein [Melioribacteraceae bacterium]|nr:Ig-like domain-containing protein [Melioribacteraceae bacterium]